MYNSSLKPYPCPFFCHQVRLVPATSLAVIRLGRAGVQECGGRCPSSMGTWRGMRSPSSRGGSMGARVGKVS